MTATSTVIGTGTPTFATGAVDGEIVHVTSPVEVLDLLDDTARVAGQTTRVPMRKSSMGRHHP